MKFKESFAAMNITTKEIKVQINNTLSKINGYKGSYISLVEDANGFPKLKILIGLSRKSTCLLKSRLASIIDTQENVYELSEELTSLLEGKFIPKGRKPQYEVTNNGLSIVLDDNMVLANLIEKEENDNHVYQFGNFQRITDAIITLQVIRMPKVTHPVRQQHNPVGNRNERHNNNNRNAACPECVSDNNAKFNNKHTNL